MDEDRQLAARAAAGDGAAFAALVRRHEAAVRRFLARLTRGDGADDLAQEAFLQAWRQAASWRGTGSYRGWLLRIAWTAFLAARRRDARRQAREQTAAPAEASGRDDPERRLDLDRALAALGEREQAAALLCFGEGCTHAEAAEIMALPLGTLKSILARARSALVRHLEAEDGR